MSVTERIKWDVNSGLCTVWSAMTRHHTNYFTYKNNHHNHNNPNDINELLFQVFIIIDSFIHLEAPVL